MADTGWFVDRNKFINSHFKFFNEEFGEVKYAYEREKTGDYVNPMHG